MIEYPDGLIDHQLLSTWGSVAGIDEVGRGSLAGPLAVGVVVIDDSCTAAPPGIADSKMLSDRARRALVAPIAHWARAAAVGWATPHEISTWGVTHALRAAALRGVSLAQTSLACQRRASIGAILLDGRHDYLSASDPQALIEMCRLDVEDPWDSGQSAPPVVTMVKADRHSHAVAAASIIAKVARDTYMSTIRDPGYAWASNKGYASRAHVEGLSRLGVSHRHRLGWRLPGVN